MISFSFILKCWFKFVILGSSWCPAGSYEVNQLVLIWANSQIPCVCFSIWKFKSNFVVHVHMVDLSILCSLFVVHFALKLVVIHVCIVGKAIEKMSLWWILSFTYLGLLYIYIFCFLDGWHPRKLGCFWICYWGPWSHCWWAV